MDTLLAYESSKRGHIYKLNGNMFNVSMIECSCNYLTLQNKRHF